MPDYLPDVYVRFRDRYPHVAEGLDALAAASDASGPLDARTRRLVKLAIAIGTQSEGAVRSNVRKALDADVSEDEIRQIAVLTITTSGFPSAVAAMGWIDEVLAAR